MANELQTIVDGDTLARVILHGDLKQLTASQKVNYYAKVCESVGLNPLTQPLQYLVLNGREILYARREATEQLRKMHHVSIAIVSREVVDGIYVVTAKATLPDGRSDENIGAVPLEGLKGEARANAMMKGETKAKRRVTLAICGLGMLDETEVESLPPSVAYTVEPPPKIAKATLKPKAEPDESLIHQDRQDPPPPADDPALPAGFVHIAKVEAHSTRNPTVTRFVVCLSTGESPTTINPLLASVAEGMCQSQTPVRIETRHTRWGDELVSIKSDDPGEEQLPLTADDIPF